MDLVAMILFDRVRRDQQRNIHAQICRLWPKMTRAQQLAWWQQFWQLGQQLGLKIKSR